MRGNDSSQPKVRVYSAKENANLVGFSQIGTPTRILLSNASPRTLITPTTRQNAADTISGRCQPSTARRTAPAPASEAGTVLRGASSGSNSTKLNARTRRSPR